jgi:hypothetical protein
MSPFVYPFIFMLRTHPLVRWVCPKDGGHKIGKVVIIEGGNDDGFILRDELILVRHCCTGELEFVDSNLLYCQPYRKD